MGAVFFKSAMCASTHFKYSSRGLYVYFKSYIFAVILSGATQGVAKKGSPKLLVSFGVKEKNLVIHSRTLAFPLRGRGTALAVDEV